MLRWSKGSFYFLGLASATNSNCDGANTLIVSGDCKIGVGIFCFSYPETSFLAGVALAAVKELHQTQQELKEKVQRIEQLEKQMAEVQALLWKLSNDK